MKILVATSEAVPLAKTGGLADVCAALPAELSRLGHEAVVFLPAYRHALRCGLAIERLGIEFDVPIGARLVHGSLLRTTLPGTGVSVYLVDQPDYFDRNELYREQAEDYRDNCERFTFFARSVLEAVRLLNLSVDVVHCNDWQTGLIPAYLAIEYRHASLYQSIATVLTIHNLAYQGVFWHWDMLLTGLDWKYFNWRQMEFWGKLNLLKTGIVFADALTTVSPTYAREIQTAEHGCGLEGVLQQRSDVLHGILNGVDYQQWDPLHDSNLAARFEVSNWPDGKQRCKTALQAELNLPVQPQTPLIGLIGRLADQKGWDLVGQVLPRWAHEQDVQWVILGTGEPAYHTLLGKLVEQFPQRIAARLGFSDALAHRIEAGSDMFLMPSRYEPCGLNQMYSLRYGTVPIVRTTGGLADTICDASAEQAAAGTANGFRFDNYTPDALDQTLRRAVTCYREQPELWRRLVHNGMSQDWSWARSAQQYVDLFQQVMARKTSAPSDG